MPRISLGTYTVRVRRKWQREEDKTWESLGSVGDRDVDLLDFFQEFCATLYRGYSVDAARESLLRIARHEIRQRTVSGLVESGPWGYAAEIVDRHTGRGVFDKTPDQAEMIPFFFLLSIPANSSRGILILQRHGRSGVKTHFCTALSRAFSQWCDGYMLDFWRHVPGRVLDWLIRGELRQLELITYQRSSDPFDELGRDQTDEWEEIRGEVRTRTTAKRGRRFPMLDLFRDVVVGERTFHEVREELGIEEGRVVMTVVYGSTERTIDLAEPMAISPYIDVTDEVEVTEGHPDPAALEAYARDLLDDLIEEVRGRYDE